MYDSQATRCRAWASECFKLKTPIHRVLKLSRRAIGESTFRSSPGISHESRRHIDSAQFYRNEAGVGKAARESGVPRDELFISA
jgi:hypothetical protein